MFSEVDSTTKMCNTAFGCAIAIMIAVLFFLAKTVIGILFSITPPFCLLFWETITEFWKKENRAQLSEALRHIPTREEKLGMIKRYGDIVKGRIVGTDTTLGHPYYSTPFYRSRYVTKIILLFTPVVRSAFWVVIIPSMLLCYLYYGLLAADAPSA